MNKKRWLYYKKEIARLQEIDKKITNKIRSSYTIKKINGK